MPARTAAQPGLANSRLDGNSISGFEENIETKFQCPVEVIRISSSYGEWLNHVSSIKHLERRIVVLHTLWRGNAPPLNDVLPRDQSENCLPDEEKCDGMF